MLEVQISGKSCDGLISHQWSVQRELEVQGLPLEVVVLLDVDGSMEDWLPYVHEHEHWHQGEEESDPVSSQTNVHHTVSLERGKWVPVSLVGWLSGEGNSLLSKTLNILVDTALNLWLDFVSLDHLDNLLLLLVHGRVLGTNLLQTLIDIVLETGTHSY